MSDTICEQLDSVYGVFHSAILKCKVTRNSDCESSFNEISCGVSLHCCTSWLNLFIVTCKKVLIGCKWWSMECFQLSKHGTDWDKESICCCDEWIGGWAPFSTLFSYTNHKIKQLHNEMSLYPQKTISTTRKCANIDMFPHTWNWSFVHKLWHNIWFDCLKVSWMDIRTTYCYYKSSYKGNDHGQQHHVAFIIILTQLHH